MSALFRRLRFLAEGGRCMKRPSRFGHAIAVAGFGRIFRLGQIFEHGFAQAHAAGLARALRYESTEIGFLLLDLLPQFPGFGGIFWE